MVDGYCRTRVASRPRSVVYLPLAFPPDPLTNEASKSLKEKAPHLSCFPPSVRFACIDLRAPAICPSSFYSTFTSFFNLLSPWPFPTKFEPPSEGGIVPSLAVIPSPTMPGPQRVISPPQMQISHFAQIALLTPGRLRPPVIPHPSLPPHYLRFYRLTTFCSLLFNCGRHSPTCPSAF